MNQTSRQPADSGHRDNMAGGAGSFPRIAVVTGTTHGIGRVSALELARAGYTVVMLSRNAAANEAVAADIRARVPGAVIECHTCDLASLASVRAAAQAVVSRHQRIDLLLNNAGIVSTRRRQSVDGFELCFATNHLGPFALTELVRERMVAGGRIVTVSSRVYPKGVLDLDAITDPAARYRSIAAYSRSKLANVLHTLGLARRLEGTGITVNCLHPGVVATHLLPGWLNLIRPLFKREILDEARGARTSLYLALSPEVQGITGRYYDEHQQAQPLAPVAADEALQERLWSASARWTMLQQPGQ